MNVHTKCFHVMIDGKGRPTVKIFPGIDTGTDLMFDKQDLTDQLEVLFKHAASSGYQIGRQSIQDKFCDLMGIRK